MSESTFFNLTRRPATPADLELIYQIRRAALGPCIEQTFGSWDEPAQRTRHEESTALHPEEHSILELDGQPVGSLCFKQSETEIYLARLFILPSFQNRGLGTRILGEILGLADQHQLPVRLRVLRVNPARAWYEQHGFAVTGQTETHFLMARPPQPLAAQPDAYDLFLHSTKYDGSLHYRYPVRTIDRSDARLVTYTGPGVAIQSYRGPRLGKTHVMTFFWSDRPYVLHVKWHLNWQPICFYVDMTTGTSWADGTVTYVDLDLDLILESAAAAARLDDEDEFEEHRLQWNYPSALVAQCHATVAEVRRLLDARQGPFSPSLYTWRPGMPVPV